MTPQELRADLPIYGAPSVLVANPALEVKSFRDFLAKQGARLHLRLAGHRHRAASAGELLEVAGRDRHRACALQRVPVPAPPRR